MAEYIKRDDALKAIDIFLLLTFGSGCDHSRLIAYLIDMIAKLPAADVAEAKRGKWEQREYFDENANTYICSVCDECWTLNAGNLKGNAMNYCPNCGAKMAEEE